MSLLPIFPDLQEISRRLRHYSSRFEFSYSETGIRLRTPPDDPRSNSYAMGLWTVINAAFCLYGCLSKEYLLVVTTILFVLIPAWNMYRRRHDAPDLKIMRVQNEVVVDAPAQRITIEHLHPYFRQQIAKTTVVRFAEIQGVVACQGRSQPDEENYGEVYLALADDRRLYLAEVDTQQLARSIARVLQRVLGLPVDPEPKRWWQF